MEITDGFARCPVCGSEWSRRIDFLSDEDTAIVAYNIDFDSLDKGSFVFTHKTCGSRLELKALHFKDLYDGPVYTERKTLSESCPRYCVNPNVLQPCPEECECAYIREIVSVIATTYVLNFVL